MMTPVAKAWNAAVKLAPGLEFVEIEEASRTQFASLYANMQMLSIDSSAFGSLGCNWDDLYVYGGFIYDMCCGGGSSACVVESDTRALVGLNVACDVKKWLSVRDWSAAGKCAAHAALSAHIVSVSVKHWSARYNKNPAEIRMLYDVFIAVDPTKKGAGVFQALRHWRGMNSFEQKWEYNVSYTTSRVVVDKGIKVKEGTPGTFKRNAVASPRFEELMISSMFAFPASILNAVVVEAMYAYKAFGDSETSARVLDCAEFRYKGKYPFKSSRIVWAGIYPPGSHTKNSAVRKKKKRSADAGPESADEPSPVVPGAHAAATARHTKAKL
eukprot:Rhum_TRINITY_DN16587_c0_g1::Rhum_TRINITY_DN16587_c0_g1_i1::g.163736::m.163736